MNKAVLYLTVKLTALAASAAYCIMGESDAAAAVISSLSLCCLFFADTFLFRYKFSRIASLIIATASAVICLYTDKSFFFPLLAVIFLCTADLLITNSSFWSISGVALLLMTMIFTPDFVSAVTALICAVFFFTGRSAVDKLLNYQDELTDYRTRLAEQKQKIADMKSYASSLKKSSALEERNRFAARIHDELGHGISGSIIMLEAAKINLRSAPDKAEEILDKAVENLRKGVDRIRASLREERPDRETLGLSGIKTILKQFSISYNIKTEISVSEHLDNIPPQIWLCIRDNLTEVLTNTLKHSDADSFSVSIQSYSKIIRAELKDNGKSSGSFNKGLGLEAIEERTAVCGGRCIFRNGQNGFSVLTIFIRESEL